VCVRALASFVRELSSDFLVCVNRSFVTVRLLKRSVSLAQTTFVTCRFAGSIQYCLIGSSGPKLGVVIDHGGISYSELLYPATHHTSQVPALLVDMPPIARSERL
jgi:hypothetical protein